MPEFFGVDFLLEDGRTVSAQAREGESLLAVAHRVDVAIDAPCSGNGTCGKCRIKLQSGTTAGARPKGISQKAFDAGERLACVCEITSDLVVSVPKSALAYQNQIRVSDFPETSFEGIFGALAASAVTDGAEMGFELLELILDAPTLDNPTADKERLIDAVARQTDVATHDITLTLTAQKKLPELLRSSDFKIHLTLRHAADRTHILDVSTDRPTLLGVAIDIGTTSVSAVLVNLESGEVISTGSAGNAQIRYGADVIGRLIESSRPGGLERLHKAITDECIKPLIGQLCAAAAVQTTAVVRVTIAANTTMSHLFAGVYGNHLRMEPYVPAFFALGTLAGAEAGIGVHPNAEVIIAPCIGSYVGGDITAGICATKLHERESLALLIDLGTNGEIVFGNRDFLMACACSAGPAFEGGEISCGMRATVGAIESCTIDPDTLEAKISVIGEADQLPIGLCGSGIVDVVGELFRCGIINAKGRFIYEGPGISTDEWGITSYTIVSAEQTERGEAITINDSDIDNFIRAKGSIFSAIITMLNTMDLDPSVIDEVYIAGGIGSGINIEHAINIGMLPKLDQEKYHYLGNTSLAGAYAMLVSPTKVQTVQDIALSMTYLELSVFPGYMDEFIAACFIPHTNAELFAEKSRQR